MQYRELQTALKHLRQAGYDVQVKLNTSYEILQAEYDRLTAIAVEPETLEQPLVMTADDFNAWVGLPTEPVAIATQDNQEQPSLPVEQPKTAIADIAVVVPMVEPSPELAVKPSNSATKQPTKQLEVMPCKPIVVTTSSYWVDGSELSQHLEATQVQALRNLQDGFRQLKQWARNLQAFAEGFAEGRPTIQPRRSPQVIALDRYRHPQVA